MSGGSEIVVGLMGVVLSILVYAHAADRTSALAGAAMASVPKPSGHLLSVLYPQPVGPPWAASVGCKTSNQAFVSPLSVRPAAESHEEDADWQQGRSRREREAPFPGSQRCGHGRHADEDEVEGGEHDSASAQLRRLWYPVVQVRGRLDRAISKR